MASEMHDQFGLQPDQYDYTWDPDRMHIFCFCHKMALIVGAGLAALGLKTSPPMKVKNVMRGAFPDINPTIIEEEEEPEDTAPSMEIPNVSVRPDDSDSDCELNLHEVVARAEEEDKEGHKDPDEEDDWDAADAEDETDPMLLAEAETTGPHPTHRRESNKLDALMDKVSYFFY